MALRSGRRRALGRDGCFWHLGQGRLQASVDHARLTQQIQRQWVGCDRGLGWQGGTVFHETGSVRFLANFTILRPPTGLAQAMARRRELERYIARHPEFGKVPVFICSSKSQETDRVWGLRQGARDYITKPVDAAQLLAKIEALA